MFSLPRAHAAQRCFTETNQCIDGRIAEFWEQNGGLAVFGFPIGPQEQTTVDGKTFTVQRFERNRLELHPENARPYDVLLGRLGADRLTQQGRDWFGFAKSGDTGGCRVFPETGHSVCGAILKAWRANGLQIDGKKAVSDAESLALFGMPLSGVLTETLSDGKQYQVQWFERARFELHPENAAPYDVLLGLLGNEVGGGSASAPAAAAPAPAKNPGSQFVPIKNRAVPPSEFTDAGSIRDFGWKTEWKINPIFAAGLNDGSGSIDNALTGDLVQTYTQSAFLFNKYYDRHWVSIEIREYTSADVARGVYNGLNNKSFYPDAHDWSPSPYGGCEQKSTLATFDRFYMGFTGAVLCGNRLAIIVSNEATTEVTETMIVDFYAAAWFPLTTTMQW
jgi:hypothetical protein